MAASITSLIPSVAVFTLFNDESISLPIFSSLTNFASAPFPLFIFAVNFLNSFVLLSRFKAVLLILLPNCSSETNLDKAPFPLFILELKVASSVEIIAALSTLFLTLSIRSSISIASFDVILSLSTTTVFETFPAEMVNTLSPINPSEFMLAIASFLMYLRTSSFITSFITTDVSFKNSIPSTVPILIPDKRTLLPTSSPLTDLNFEYNSNVDPNRFFCFPTKYIVPTNNTKPIITNIPSFH